MGPKNLFKEVIRPKDTQNILGLQENQEKKQMGPRRSE